MLGSVGVWPMARGGDWGPAVLAYYPVKDRGQEWICGCARESVGRPWWVMARVLSPAEKIDNHGGVGRGKEIGWRYSQPRS